MPNASVRIALATTLSTAVRTDPSSLVLYDVSPIIYCATIKFGSVETFPCGPRNRPVPFSGVAFRHGLRQVGRLRA